MSLTVIKFILICDGQQHFLKQRITKAGDISHDNLSRLLKSCLMLAIMIAAKDFEYFRDLAGMFSAIHASKKDVVEVESVAPIVYMNRGGWQIFTKNLAKIGQF